jgi:oligopeptide transport system substrate-binding protein
MTFAGRLRAATAAVGTALACLGLGACTNNPYPNADDEQKVRYRYLPDPPRTFDPAVSYTRIAHIVLVNVYETLLEYHYLKRPYEMIPGLAREVPVARAQPDGRVAYSFRLRPDMRYQDDPAFSIGDPGGATREIVAADVEFELMRLADPEVNSPIVAPMSKIEGFAEFSAKLAARREAEPAFAELRIDRQYREIGGIPGVKVSGAHELEIVLSGPYPQILYWFAMGFTAPVPWEAVVYYDGEDGRDNFRDHPVSTGPYKFAHNDRYSRIVLERNENWYGIRHPEWKAPGATYPSEGAPGDRELGRLDPAYVGQPLPFTDRIEFRIEKEDIPRFNKFYQGYYDQSSIINESFDQMIHQGGLSAEMERRGMQLDKAVDPDIFYVGFNLEDPVVGVSAGERGRKLRHAMSHAVDVEEYRRVFMNGRGIPANFVVPPGIFGYEEGYRNPARSVDLERARALLVEAGYPDGIDAETGRPLKLSFDTGDTTSRGRIRYQFFVDHWNRIGLDVEINATNYNQFREKMRKGSYQIYMSGWIADYPDPENFLFLLWGENAGSTSGGENHANFRDPRFDELFVTMKNMENGPRRLAVIREMRAILERERPWIELFHRENYALYQGWTRNVKTAGLTYPQEKYRDIDVARRVIDRELWNRPIRWPAYAVASLTLLATIPGITTFFRERQ